MDTIGRYRVLDEVGAGGFATVYRAHDPVLDRELAIKLLHGHLARDPQLRMRFVREGRALARIRHPNVVQVHDAGETDGSAYLAMEFVAGASLAALAKQRPLALGELVSIVRQVASALDMLHAGGLVHRDIKPANILVQPDGRAVLLDLGVAHTQDASMATTSGLIVGTPGFLAPEQVEPRAPVSAATDVYQLAATVYTLLAGRPPFEGDTVQVLYAVVHRDPPDLRQLRPDLPPHVIAAVGAGMAKDPAMRPRRATDFAAMLAGAAYAPVTPPPAPPSGQWRAAATAPSGAWHTTPPSALAPTSTPPPTPTPAPHPWTTGVTPPPQSSASRSLPEWWPAALAGVAAVALLLAAVLILTSGGGANTSTPVSATRAPTTPPATGRAGAAVAITLSPTAAQMATPTPLRAAANTATVPPSTPTPAECQWTGNWSTTFGAMTLRQSSTTVSGTYDYRSGELSGSVNSSLLRGRWEEKPLPNAPPAPANEYVGDFEFTMSADCRSFTGRWRHGSDGQWQEWLGQRR